MSPGPLPQAKSGGRLPDRWIRQRARKCCPWRLWFSRFGTKPRELRLASPGSIRHGRTQAPPCAVVNALHSSLVPDRLAPMAAAEGIAVTGVTGGLGGRVARRAGERGVGQRLVARDPGR